MSPIRALVWLGVVGWGLVFLNFGVAFVLRQSLLRFTWALAALAAGVHLYSRIEPVPDVLRLPLTVALFMAGIGCGVSLTVTLLRRGSKVLR